MSLLDMNFDDAVEPTVVDPGEYKIRIVDVKVAENKSGNPYVLPRFEIPDEPTAKEFTKYMGLPHDDMNEKQLNSAKFNMKKFCLAFGIDPAAPGEPDDWKGLEGWALLGVEENDEYGDQNYVKSFIKQG